MTRYLFISLICSVFIISGCESEPVEQVAAKSDYKTLDWEQLIPKDELEILMNPPAYIWEIEDGSEEDQLSSSLQSSPVDQEQDLYQQALVSTNVIDEFDQQKVRLPGFIVPLEFNEDSVITTFFLVPFFGACTHEPPPPPNQIIYSEYEPGQKVDNIYEPVWITGIIHTNTQTNHLATSAYSMIVDSVLPYD